MVVAYFVPHNEGIVAGILTEVGQDTGTSLIDLYEVDATIKAFEDHTEAYEWLLEKIHEMAKETTDEQKMALQSNVTPFVTIDYV